MTDPYKTKDSGTRRTFDTGSVRDAATGKGRYDLVSPIALLRVALLYERGAVKYDPRNWEKGQPLTVFLDCAIRHLQKHLAGFRDEDHMAAACWNTMGFIHVEDMVARGLLPAELNDLPCFVTPEEAAAGKYLPPMPTPKPPEHKPRKSMFKVGDKVKVNISCQLTSLHQKIGSIIRRASDVRASWCVLFDDLEDYNLFESSLDKA